jgi:hypothetical protein
MRVASILLIALPVLAVAEQAQKPLLDRVKDGLGWVGKQTGKVTEKVAAYVPSSVPSPKNPVNAGAGKVAEYVVEKLNMSNWRDVLMPEHDATKAGAGPQEWMVFLTGGNKTCNGLCGNVTNEWNKAVTLLAPLPDRPNLAYADCDKAPVLCAHWNIAPAVIYHMLVPQPLEDQSMPTTDVRQIRLNRYNATATDIVKIHTEKGYAEHPLYEGAFHPFNGWLQQYGLAAPYGWFSATILSLPSWAPMIIVSFASRYFLTGRGRAAAMPRRPNNAAAGGAPAAAQ